MFDYQYDGPALLAELHLDNLDAKDQAATLERIDQLLQDRVTIRFEMELDDASLEAFSKLTTAEDARAFLLEKIPTVQEIYDEEFEGIIDQLRGGLA